MYMAVVSIAMMKTQGGELSNWLPTTVQQHYKLRLVSERYKNSLVCTLERSDGAVVDIRCRDAMPESLSQKAGVGLDVESSRYLYRHSQTPSGFPIGTLSSWLPDVFVDFRVAGKHESLQVKLQGKSWSNGRSRGASSLNGLDESPMVEALSRHSLGSYAAKRLAADGSVSIGGRSYLAMKATGTNTRYIDLAAWAERNNLVVGSGQDGTVKSFTTGGQLWIIPLASVKIKKGSTWQSLPDLVMRKDGKFYIPVAALQ